MAEDLRMALQELLRKAEMDGDIDFLREGVRVLAQELMEIEVAQHVGADRYERAVDRTGERNGYREPDAARRKALYSQLNDIILDLCGTMPLSRYPQTAILRANVQGLTYNQMPKFTFDTAWLA